MGAWLSRRRFMALAVGTLSMAARARRVEATALDTCYWRKEYGPVCSVGTSVERWCYRCCDIEAGCTVIRCELRIVGSC